MNFNNALTLVLTKSTNDLYGKHFTQHELQM